MGAATTFIRDSRVLYSPLAEGEGVLLSVEAGVYYSLNRTGVLVWERLQTQCSLEDLVQSICRDFRATPEQLRHDLGRLLEELLRAGLVRSGDEAT